MPKGTHSKEKEILREFGRGERVWEAIEERNFGIIRTNGGGWPPAPAISMSAFTCNCKGLGTRRAVRELVDIVQAQGPKIVFLLKTWSDKEYMEKVRCDLEFDGLFTIPKNGQGGGLAMLWKSEIVVWVDSFSNYHIDVIVNGDMEDAWRLTGFYGEPATNRRSEGWNMLQMLSSKSKLPWCCFGDFNKLLRVEDK